MKKNYTLRKHQQSGVDFGEKRAGTMFEHDMGTGKTLTAIELALLKDKELNIVIAPKNLIDTWVTELTKTCGVSEEDIFVHDRAFERRAEEEYLGTFEEFLEKGIEW